VYLLHTVNTIYHNKENENISVSADKYHRIFSSQFIIGFQMLKSNVQVCRVCVEFFVEVNEDAYNEDGEKKLKTEYVFHLDRATETQENLKIESLQAKDNTRWDCVNKGPATSFTHSNSLPWGSILQK
jgi:uncharacterized protein YxeA